MFRALLCLLAAPLALAGLRERGPTGTLTGLAREGPLRGCSLGTAWSRDSGEAVRRELFVKFQQGWPS